MTLQIIVFLLILNGLKISKQSWLAKNVYREDILKKAVI